MPVIIKKNYMGSSSVAEGSLRTLCLNKEWLCRWKPECFRHGRGRGRHAHRIQGKNGKGVLMVRQETAQALGTEKKSDPEDIF